MIEALAKESASYTTLNAPFANFPNYIYCDFFSERVPVKLQDYNESLPLQSGWAMLSDSYDLLSYLEQSTRLAFAVFYSNKIALAKLVIEFLCANASSESGFFAWLYLTREGVAPSLEAVL